MAQDVKFPDIGKISPEFFDAYIYQALGAKRSEVLVGPGHGVDIAVVATGPGKVMAATTDPIAVLPWFGWEEAAWLSWHILASDITTCGLPPAYIVCDFNLPMEITTEQFATFWKVWDRESKRYGAAIIAGHTARYTGTAFPMVGGATFIAVGDENAYVTPQMARPGDVLCMTKTAAVEAVGIFARLFRKKIETELGEETARKGWDLFYQMTTIDDALAAAGFGLRDKGVTAMHDATECGVIGASVEMADASGIGLELEYDKIVVYPEARAICELFGMQPEIAIAEGCLILAVKTEHLEALKRHMQSQNVPLAEIGQFLPPSEGINALRAGKREKLEHPRVDPYWRALDKAMAENQ